MPLLVELKHTKATCFEQKMFPCSGELNENVLFILKMIVLCTKFPCKYFFAFQILRVGARPHCSTLDTPDKSNT